MSLPTLRWTKERPKAEGLYLYRADDQHVPQLAWYFPGLDNLRSVHSNNVVRRVDSTWTAAVALEPSPEAWVERVKDEGDGSDT